MQVISNLEISPPTPIPRWSGHYNHKTGHITNPVFEHFIEPQKDLVFLWEELSWELDPAFLDTR